MEFHRVNQLVNSARNESRKWRHADLPVDDAIPSERDFLPGKRLRVSSKIAIFHPSRDSICLRHPGWLVFGCVLLIPDLIPGYRLDLS